MHLVTNASSASNSPPFTDRALNLAFSDSPRTVETLPTAFAAAMGGTGIRSSAGGSSPASKYADSGRLPSISPSTLLLSTSTSHAPRAYRTLRPTPDLRPPTSRPALGPPRREESVCPEEQTALGAAGALIGSADA